jgi:23S rRNA pseudouridine2605 synthase
MRLNRFLALAGVASRRGAETFIRQGRVTINGRVSTDLSSQVEPSDHVRVDGHLVHPKQFISVLLNKPPGFLTTRSDRNDRRTIYALLPRKMANLAHVGRLDKESEGLLLLTNDGDLALRLTHPRFKLEKEYLVTLDREFGLEDLPNVCKGVYLAEGRARFDALHKVNPHQVRVILTQGIKRQVRRVFAALGYKVKRLQRTRIGPLTDRDLKPGTFRILTPAEVASLKSANQPSVRAAEPPASL